jgi:hypothetical protein
VLPEQLPAVILGQLGTAVERIHDDEVGAAVAADDARCAQQKMSGKVDPVDAQPGAARHFEVHDREADWNSGAPIEHFVDEAVARIVVAVAVPGESLLVVQVLVERAERVFASAVDARRGLASHDIEYLHVRSRIQRRVFDPCDGERRAGQLVAWRIHRALQFSGDFPDPCVQMQRKRHAWIVARFAAGRPACPLDSTPTSVRRSMPV